MKFCLCIYLSPSQSGLTPLHLAAQEDKVNVAEVLVNQGATIDPETKVILLVTSCLRDYYFSNLPCKNNAKYSPVPLAQIIRDKQQICCFSLIMSLHIEYFSVLGC